MRAPLGFCCGGFSSTAGYVPGNEAQHPRASSDIGSYPVVPSEIVLSVFIRITRRNLAISFPAKPFGFDAERNSNKNPPLATLKRCVAATAASLRIGQKPVSNFDL
jgi:hypothetical protein